MLQQHFEEKGEKSLLIPFPDRSTQIGGIINQYLKQTFSLPDEAVHLLFSANRWEMKEKITQALESGCHVLLDRYAYSGVAYTASKGLSLQYCMNPDRGLPRPDVVFFMEMDIQDISERAGFGEEIYEKESFQKKVQEVYCELEEKDYWVRVSGKGSREEIHCRVVEESGRVETSRAVERLWEERE